MNIHDTKMVEGWLAAEEAQLRARKAEQDMEFKRMGLLPGQAKPKAAVSRPAATVPPKRAAVMNRSSEITIMHRDGRRELVDPHNPGKWKDLIEECQARCAELDRERRHSHGYLLSQPISDVPVVD